MLSFLVQVADDSNQSEEYTLFRANFDVFMCDVQWDTLLMRFTSPDVGSMLASVRSHTPLRLIASTCAILYGGDLFGIVQLLTNRATFLDRLKKCQDVSSRSLRYITSQLQPAQEMHSVATHALIAIHQALAQSKNHSWRTPFGLQEPIYVSFAQMS